MFMEIKSGKIRILKVCLILVLSFSIIPEVVSSFEDTYDRVETGSDSQCKTDSCDEHNCPVLPDEPFHHCAVCCAVSHSFIPPASGIILRFSNTSQPSSTAEDVIYKELFAETLFRPPQSIL
jgi:hypothetical protein